MASPELTKLSIANAPEGEKAKARIATARANLNAGGVRKGATIVAPEVATTPITPQDMEPTPVINVPTPALPTESPALASDLAVMAEDEFTKRTKQEAAAAETQSDSALQSYLKAVQASKGLSTLQSEEYATQGGVNDITPELNDINDRIRREQRALDLAKRNITESGGGLASGAASEIQNLERVSLQKQADLSIIQMAVQGRYDSAKEIADRAVTAKFEQQTIFNDTLKFAYEEAKDIFTTKEQREFETLLSNRTQAIADAKENAKNIQNFALSALQAGAPVSVAEKIQKATSMEEAIALGGEYLRPKTEISSPKRDTQVVDGKLIDMQTGEVISTLGGGVRDEGQQTQINETLSLARELLSEETAGKSGAIGFGLQKFVPFGKSLGLQGDRTSFDNKVDTLKANLTLPNLTLLKGPMSDKDIAFLQAIGSSITSNMSEKEFDAQLKKVIEKFENKVSTPTTQGTRVITAPDGTEIEIID